MNGFAEQLHAPDGVKRDGADAASSLVPLVMQVDRLAPLRGRAYRRELSSKLLQRL
jgi:hypothetical protein